MEQRKVILFYDLCRLCLENAGADDVFTTTDLVEDIFQCTGVNVTSHDNLPRKICVKCLDIVVKAKELRVLATANDRHLNSLFDDGETFIIGFNNKQSQNEIYTNSRKSSTDSDRTVKLEIDESNDVILEEESVSKKRKSSDASLNGQSEEKKIAVRKDLFESSIAVISSTKDEKSDQKTKQNLKVKIKRFKTENDDCFQYVCDVCQKKFDAWKKYYLHQKTHNRNVYCPLDACGKKFATKGDLEKHVRTHTEITTFNTMDPQAHVVSTSSTPMETEDVLPSTSAIPPIVQHSANPAESNTLRNQITTLNMMDPCAHIPSTSSTPMETEDALPSTSAIPTTAEKNALRNREYRKRVAATRTPEQAAAFARKAAERQRKAYHLRRAANLALASGTVETTTIVQTSAQRKRASRQRQAERVRSAAQPSTSSNQAAVHQEQPTWSTKWSSSIHRFESTFLDNDFGHTCSVCDRLWFRNDLKAITAAQMQIISDWCVKENRQVHAQEFTLVCANCKRSLNTGKLPSLAKMNGFTYPEVLKSMFV